MPRLPRLVAPGYPHHLTQRGVRSLDVFTNDDQRWAYLHFLAEEAKVSGVQFLSWCLMTNHVHFLVVPEKSDSLARCFGEAHRRYTRMRNFQEGVRGYLFQGRFGSCVLDEHHLIAATRYVERNPVKAGMVHHAQVYLWSSARFHLGINDNDVLVTDRTLLGLVSDWESLLLDECEEDSEKLRKASRTGRPAGSEKFIDEIERVTGRNAKPKRPGRPRRLG